MKKIFSLTLLMFCSACDGFNNQKSEYSPEELLGKTVAEYEALQAERNKTDNKQKQASKPIVKNGYLQLDWDNLIAPGYETDTILAKYEPLIQEIPHGSEAAFELYQKMEEEFNNAPPNPNLADQKVSIPGFIAPLDQVNGMITEFLLVPYFGACIHYPPPPANQTVHVKIAADYAIHVDDSYDPIWVSGQLLIDNSNTEIGNASYQINNALISPYN